VKLGRFAVVHVDTLRLCLWTAVTNWPIVYPPDIWVWRAMVEWYWQGKAEELGEKPVLVPLCPLQIPRGLTWARSWASAVRGRRLSAWAMARPLGQFARVTGTWIFLFFHSIQVGSGTQSRVKTSAAWNLPSAEVEIALSVTSLPPYAFLAWSRNNRQL
jgi:hypothetical protein